MSGAKRFLIIYPDDGVSAMSAYIVKNQALNKKCLQ